MPPRVWAHMRPWSSTCWQFPPSTRSATGSFPPLKRGCSDGAHPEHPLPLIPFSRSRVAGRGQSRQCRAVDLKNQFQVSHVTVSRTIGRLQRDGFVVTEPYGPIELTNEGKKLAQYSRRRHDIVYRFLRAIGVSESTAATDSEGIEHHVSPETLRAMQDFADGNEVEE